MPGMGWQDPIHYKMGRGINFIIKEGPIFASFVALIIILKWQKVSLKGKSLFFVKNKKMAIFNLFFVFLPARVR